MSWKEKQDAKLSTLATDGPNILTIQEPLVSSISYTRMYPEQMLWACTETKKREEEEHTVWRKWVKNQIRKPPSYVLSQDDWAWPHILNLHLLQLQPVHAEELERFLPELARRCHNPFTNKTFCGDSSGQVMTKKSICQIELFVQRVFGGGGGAEDPKSALNSRDLSQNNFHPGQTPITNIIHIQLLRETNVSSSGLPHSDELVELKEGSWPDLWLLLSGQLACQPKMAPKGPLHNIDGFIDRPNKDDCPFLLTGDVKKPCDINTNLAFLMWNMWYVCDYIFIVKNV